MTQICPNRRPLKNPLRKFALNCRSLALLALAATLMAPTKQAFAADATGQRTVTVSASAHVDARPDAASIITGVTTQAQTAAQALAENSKIVGDIIDGLIELGIPDKDIQTASINVNPRYDRPKDGSAPTVRGYTVSNTISITSRDLDALGQILDRLVTLGANQMRGLSFQVTDAENLKDAARTKAIENARRRAELFAAAAGASVGKVLHISEGATHSPSPRRLHMARSAGAESVPIAPGTQSLTARVTVTWQLRD